MIQARACRSCGSPLQRTFLDLGRTPLANAFIDKAKRDQPETQYPLHAFVCSGCFLVQVADFVAPKEIFSDYLYFSSYSASWVQHCQRYAQEIIGRLALDRRSLVVEVASNDGYLLRNFIEAGIPSLGVEPAENVAAVAVKAGVPTMVVFFGRESARTIAAERGQADLIVCNNVLAHVPDLNDFIAGLAALLKPDGTVTIEFPHLLNLMRETQFDTIYHEHFSYFSLLALEPAFQRHELAVHDVEKLPTHGGSLRLHVSHAGARRLERSPRVAAMRAEEEAAGLARLETYDGFAERVLRVKLDLLEFLIQARRQGKTVAGFGAAAKGNTLLNYCGIRPDLICAVADSNPNKQQMSLPGSGIPVVPPADIATIKPQYLLILPWNIRDEIMELTQGIRAWGGRFVVAVPKLEVLS